MEVGQVVVFVGCAHEEACPDTVRPCSVDVWGRLELVGFEVGGDPLTWWAKPEGGQPERFLPGELDTIENVAAVAAARAGGEEG